jgi:hypothetical protein
VLLGPLKLLVGGAVGAQRGELAPDDLARLADVVLAGADVHRDRPGLAELLGVRAHGVGEPPLLTHLLKQARRRRASKDRVEHREREAAFVAARDSRPAEADVVLLGVLLVEADARIHTRDAPVRGSVE